MQTVNQRNQREVPFNTGLLVNKIYLNKVTGKKKDALKLREKIENAASPPKFVTSD